MTKFEVLGGLNAILDQFIIAANIEDDDKWYLAMHSIRDLAWQGKEIIHEKRLAKHEATRVPRGVRVAVISKLSPEELHQLMKDLGL